MNVTIIFSGLGDDLGPFILNPNVGVVIPNTATRTDLLSPGLSLYVDPLMTDLTVTSMGICTNSVTLSLTTSTTSTTTTGISTSTSTTTTTSTSHTSTSTTSTTTTSTSSTTTSTTTTSQVMLELMSTSKSGTHSSSGQACSDTAFVDQLWTLNHPIVDGNIVYNTNSILDRFNGNNYYYGIKFPSESVFYTMQVSGTGVVSNVSTNCLPAGALGSVNMVPNGSSVHDKSISSVYWNNNLINVVPTVNSEGPDLHSNNLFITNDLNASHTFKVTVAGNAGVNDFVEMIDSTGTSTMLHYTSSGDYLFNGKTINDGGTWRVNFYTNLVPKYTLKNLTIQSDPYKVDMTIAIENNMPNAISPSFTFRHNSAFDTATFINIQPNTGNLYTATFNLGAAVNIGDDFTLTETSNAVIINNTATLNYDDPTVFVKSFGPYFAAQKYSFVYHGAHIAYCDTYVPQLLYSLDKLDIGRFYPVYDPITGEVINTYQILAVTTYSPGFVVFNASAVSYISCNAAAQSPPF